MFHLYREMFHLLEQVIKPNSKVLFLVSKGKIKIIKLMQGKLLVQPFQQETIRHLTLELKKIMVQFLEATTIVQTKQMQQMLHKEILQMLHKEDLLIKEVIKEMQSLAKNLILHKEQEPHLLEFQTMEQLNRKEEMYLHRVKDSKLIREIVLLDKIKALVLLA